MLEESSANPAIKAEVAKVFSGEIRFGSPDAEKMDILTLLRRRAGDDKCGVRKAALQVPNLSLRSPNALLGIGSRWFAYGLTFLEFG